MKANNNPKNRRGLLDYQKRQIELAELTENDARRHRIQSNLDKWIDNLPPMLKIATPKLLPKKTLASMRITPLKPPYKNVIITSSDTTTSTFTAYALLYTLIRGGLATPSEIKTTSLLDGYNNISGIFNSRKWKDYFFDSNAKILLVEGASKHVQMLGSKGEDRFWRELIEFTRNNDKMLIITYTTDKEEEKKGTFVPSIAGEFEINSRLLTKSVYIFMTDEEEKEIRNEQAKFY